jgi:2'-hydroxyisoflavone reductase
MKILILGGTVFLGRHLVDAALARGHEVTLFNRGQHNPDLYPELERLRGDRDGGLDALKSRQWDAAIDTCGYVPRIVRASATLLADAVAHYTFISTISVYADVTQPGVDERGPVGTLADATVEEITGETYGPLKALCEEAVEAALPGRALIIRPGLIVGPYDPTDRFTYWPVRVARGGEVLAPGRPARAIQVIDGRDLAEWTVRMVEGRRAGIYNADGPDYLLTMGALLDTCREVAGSDARFTWVGDEALLAAGATPWSEVPVWVPEREAQGFFSIDCGKALAAGLTIRPIAETVRDTLAWHATRPAGPMKAGMTREREAELLRAVAEAI